MVTVILVTFVITWSSVKQALPGKPTAGGSQGL